METPKYDLSSATYESVYEPSEDSFLLIDALELEIEAIKKSRPLICMEIGSGSGVIITALAMALKTQPCHFVAVDVNPEACSATQRTSAINDVTTDVVRMDLTSAFLGNKIFDLIIFNPPYVATDPSEVACEKMIYKTWAGGEAGRKIIERLFDKIPKILSRQGVFYLLVLRENNPDYIMAEFEKFGLQGKVVLERKIPGEYLYILKFEWKDEEVGKFS